MISNGCLGTRDWQYPPSSTGTYLEAKASNPIQAKVVVLPFEDLRGTKVKEEYWKAAIPLVLHAETEYDRPEEAVKPEQVDVVRFNPPKDFAEATAMELREAGFSRLWPLHRKGRPLPLTSSFEVDFGPQIGNAGFIPTF